MAIRARNIEDIKDKIRNDEKLRQKLQADPTKLFDEFKNDIKEHPLTNDKWIYRAVVLALSIIIAFILTATFVLYLLGIVDSDKTVPTLFTAIASAAIGALAGLLAPGSRSK